MQSDTQGPEAIEVPYAYPNGRIVAIASGGLDSTTLVYDLREHGYEPFVISFDYGQRHSRELDYMAATCKKLSLTHNVVDLTSITRLISNSVLTNLELEVPEGHYAQDNMAQTVVPNRNMIMLAIAGGYAVNIHAKGVATGVHAGDHAIYPDCRPEFIFSCADTLFRATEGFNNFEIDPNGTGRSVLAPYLYWSKTQIAMQAIELGVPFNETWSCYKGGDKHCGKCGTCVERLEAIAEAQDEVHAGNIILGAHASIEDATEYEDTEYWKATTNRAPEIPGWNTSGLPTE